MLVKCINKKCSHKWDYQGKSKNYISCPKCSYRFKLQRGIYEHSKTMLTYPRNIPHNIVNIVPKSPLKPKKNVYRKVIEKPKTEFIEKKELEEVDNVADFNLAVLNEQMKNKNKKTEIKESVEEYEPVIKLCEKHKLSARYDSYEKKWRCRKCVQEKIDNSIKESGIKVIRSTEHLGIVREINEDIKVTQIPFENKVGVNV